MAYQDGRNATDDIYATRLDASGAVQDAAGIPVSTAAGEQRHPGIASDGSGYLVSWFEDMGAPIRSLRVDGGLTRSAVLMQAQADLLQVPVEVYPSPHATPLGAAALARLALSPQLRLADVLWPWEPARVYTPQWSPDRAAEYLDRWCAAVEATLTGGRP